MKRIADERQSPIVPARRTYHRPIGGTGCANDIAEYFLTRSDVLRVEVTFRVGRSLYGPVEIGRDSASISDLMRGRSLLLRSITIRVRFREGQINEIEVTSTVVLTTLVIDALEEGAIVGEKLRLCRVIGAVRRWGRMMIKIGALAVAAATVLALVLAISGR